MIDQTWHIFGDNLMHYVQSWTLTSNAMMRITEGLEQEVKTILTYSIDISYADTAQDVVYLRMSWVSLVEHGLCVHAFWNQIGRHMEICLAQGPDLSFL